jgi:protein TorT
MISYVAQSKATQPWQVCVSFPHMKDPFFVAADYGVIEEAKRLGVKVQVLDAGGYTELSQQISQVQNCVAGGAKAVVLVGISHDGMGNLLDNLKSKHVVVIDAVNGIGSNDVGARVLTSPYDEGLHSGQYLARRYPAGSKPVRVAWFPGPAGAGFEVAFTNGFMTGIKGSAVQVVDTRNGDVGKEVQARLVENALQAHKDLDYIVGTAVTVEAAVPLLRAHHMDKQVKLVSLYATPNVLRDVKDGTIEAVHVSPVVTTARMALDTAVRLLQDPKPEPLVRYDTVGRIYTAQTLDTLDEQTVIAPEGFKPVFRYAGN